MRQATKKLFSLGLGGLLTFGMVGCGNSNSQITTTTPEANAGNTGSKTEAASSSPEEVVKPEKITMMVNGSFVSPANGQAELVAKYKELTGIDLEIITIDHNSYNDQLALAFTSDSVADVILLSAENYAAYAAQGALWDITESWEKSETKESGRFANEYIDEMYIEDRLYGFATARGNGCLTYLRKDWLDKLGLEIPTTYDEYINVLRAFVNEDPDGNGKNDTMGVTAAGIIGGEAPYINYLPEFWQDAYPAFYEKEDGTWVDGFTEEATAKALQRLKDAYAEGLIDMEITTNKTSSCRDKFYAGNVGAFTYWAGKWGYSLDENVKAQFPEAEVVGIAPLKEVGQYIERQCPILGITSKAENPEGIFKYLFEVMVDGSEGQKLFTYGVEDVHYEYKEGVAQALPTRENPNTLFVSAYTDPMLSLSKWIDEDILKDARDPRAVASDKTFYENAKVAPLVISNEVMGNYAAEIKDIKEVIVADVVTGDMTVEEGMASYQEQASAMVEEVLASLNN